MSKLRFRLLFAALGLAAVMPAFVTAQQTVGGLDVNVKNVKADGKPVKLSRKRFFLFKGGLKENEELLKRIDAAEIASRNCYYTGQKASPAYICWLQAENCESPFCRIVDARYVDETNPTHVPEFLTAYKTGLKLYNNRKDISLEWIIPNMTNNLVDGYYREQQKVLRGVLGTTKQITSSMIDTSSTKTIFLDLPFNGTETKVKYLVSNVLPIEIGDKSYVWTCEKDVEAGKKTILDMSKTGKNCVTTVLTVRNCETLACEVK
ncbi:MAG: hypothetical protein ABIV21_05395 [Pyrinomonadaceae bacterium]